jgi:hypothetical protein
MAGTDFVHNVGDQVEFDDTEAVRLIEAGIAEPCGPETASTGPAENAAKPKGNKRVSRTRNSAD